MISILIGGLIGAVLPLGIIVGFALVLTFLEASVIKSYKKK